jgi:hypothetical protein
MKIYAIAFLIVCLSAISGCATRTIYVPAGTPVQLAAPVKNTPVWIPDKNGVRVRSRMTLNEGLWVIEDIRK